MDALLHGHSYSGHPVGASAGVSALSIFANPALNPALEPSGGRLRELWPAPMVHQLSNTPGVESVIAIGELLSTAAGNTAYRDNHPYPCVQRGFWELWPAFWCKSCHSCQLLLCSVSLRKL